ncbi:MAG: homoserine dehydrogenase [Bryobacteraceae bacterium]
MKIALIGFGNVGRALARLLGRVESPFHIAGIHTRHGTAYGGEMGGPAASVEEFLDTVRAEVAVELTSLNPLTGEPAASHIRAAIERGMHVVTANKGPVAHRYAELRDLAAARGVAFRFESTVMDGAPVFNMVRECLPGVKVLGFTGVLNSTSKVVIEVMEQGGTLEDGIAEARSMGIVEADASYDLEGWDSAAKTAALANVLMDAGATPLQVNVKGITRLTPERVRKLAREGKTVRLVSRAKRTGSLRVRAEVLDRGDLLASVKGTSNLLLLDTDLMGTVGTVSIAPGVEQTAYGVYSDLMSVWKNK